MYYEQPGKEGSIVTFNKRYYNFIGGKWVAPAYAAGNCVVLKPAEQTPASIHHDDGTDCRFTSRWCAELGAGLRAKLIFKGLLQINQVQYLKVV